MMLIAMISPIEIGILLIVAFVGYRWMCRRGCTRPASGFVLKTLGIVAVVAGLGVLLTRSERHVYVNDEDVAAGHTAARSELREELQEMREEIREEVEDFRENLADELNFGDEFPHGDFVRPFHEGHTVTHSKPSRGMLILLGSGLIILGAILFGRERTRPFALKAITWLGVGAILFSVVNYFGSPPRSPDPARRIARLHPDSDAKVFEIRKPKKVADSHRARRPNIRPLRPAPGVVAEEEVFELPERAGEIPVDVKVAIDPKPVVPETPGEVAAEPKAEVAAVEVAAVEAKPKATPQEETAEEKAVEKPAEVVKKEEPKKDKPKTPATPVAKVKKPAKAAETVELTETTVVESGARPAWVDALPSLNGSVYALAVNSGPHTSIPDCQRYLDDEIETAANEYINQYIGEPDAAEQVAIPLAYLKQYVKKAEFAEIIDSPSVGKMHQLHARLEFDDDARADFQRRWRNAVVQDRLWYTGGGAALVLALLATFYGYLRLDLKTDNANKGRLQLAATLVALIVAAGALIARWAMPF